MHSHVLKETERTQSIQMLSTDKKRGDMEQIGFSQEGGAFSIKGRSLRMASSSKKILQNNLGLKFENCVSQDSSQCILTFTEADHSD